MDYSTTINEHFFFKKMFIFEKQHEQGRGRERGRQRIGSRLSTDSRESDVELELPNLEIMT